jgi:UDP-N-acetylmuramate--alanine ligase
MVTEDRPTVAVAGTHGKTTVSTMLAHLLTAGGVKCNAFLGGIAVNYGTNVLLNDDAVVNVVEADEYDRSFLRLHPSESIITAMDPDHLDIYGTAEAMFAAYTEFAALSKGMLLVHQRVASHFGKHPGAVSYALDHTGTPRAEHVHVDTGRYVFDLVAEGHTLRDLQLGMPGRHNVENALAASTMALRLGVTPEALRAGLASFKGVSRRFEVRVNGPKVVFIDDYAHHPKELEACIRSNDIVAHYPSEKGRPYHRYKLIDLAPSDEILSVGRGPHHPSDPVRSNFKLLNTALGLSIPRRSWPKYYAESQLGEGPVAPLPPPECDPTHGHS